MSHPPALRLSTFALGIFMTKPFLPFTLIEARFKLRRGKEHFYIFEAESRKFWDSDPYTLILDYDGEESKNVLRFQWTEPAPQLLWGAMLGDAIHNARSALDYIAWQLAGSDLADRASLFPIYKSPDDWSAKKWRYEKRPIHPEAVAFIQSLQPYRRPEPERTKLWILQELDARDKHKFIALIQSLARTAQVSGMGHEMLIPYSAIEAPLENGTVIVEYPGPMQLPTNLKVDLAFQVAFDKAAGVLANRGVGSILTPIFDAVDFIIDSFEAHPDWFPS
jgi:hypothetical protein